MGLLKVKAPKLYSWGLSELDLDPIYWNKFFHFNCIKKVKKCVSFAGAALKYILPCHKALGIDTTNKKGFK